MNEEQVRQLMLFINTGVRILSARILLFVTLLLTFAIWCWALYYPTHERIVLATIFAVLVFLPVVRTDARTIEVKQTIEGA